MSRLEDLGGEVTAWVVIPKDDKSSLIHHMGSKKGREFIQCKPDIDAELHVFLQNYKKKGNKNINIKLCVHDLFLGNPFMAGCTRYNIM